MPVTPRQSTGRERKIMSEKNEGKKLLGWEFSFSLSCILWISIICIDTVYICLYKAFLKVYWSNKMFYTKICFSCEEVIYTLSLYTWCLWSEPLWWPTVELDFKNKPNTQSIFLMHPHMFYLLIHYHDIQGRPWKYIRRENKCKRERMNEWNNEREDKNKSEKEIETDWVNDWEKERCRANFERSTKRGRFMSSELCQIICIC